MVFRNTILAICTLTLCGSLLMLWRSQWTAELVAWTRGGKSYLLISYEGRFLYLVEMPQTPRPDATARYQSYPIKENFWYWTPMIWNGKTDYISHRWAGFEWAQTIALKPLTPNNGKSPSVNARYNDFYVYYNLNPTQLLAIPWWFVSALSTIPIALFAYSYRKTVKRLRTGHCPNCGYDLRATPKRCPECGWVVVDLLRSESSLGSAEKLDTSADPKKSLQ